MRGTYRKCAPVCLAKLEKCAPTKRGVLINPTSPLSNALQCLTRSAKLGVSPPINILSFPIAFIHSPQKSYKLSLTSSFS